MTVENGSLEQQQRSLRNVSPGDLLIMAKDPTLDGIERGLRLLAIAGHHIEGHLRVEDVFRQRLKGEQVYRLLVQFVHAALAMFGGRFKNRGYRAPDRARFPDSPQKQRQRPRDRG